MCDKMRGHEPTDPDALIQSLPPPFGGPGGLFGERPPVDATDEELDIWCEKSYNESMRVFEAVSAATRRHRRRRVFHDYTIKNCEEAYGSQV